MGKVADYYKSQFVTSVFGEYRDGGRKHRGVDFAHGNNNHPVPAARSGIVVGIRVPSNTHGFGYGVIVRSTLDDGNDWDISYNHGAYRPSFKVGDKISAGQTLLTEGLTGWTTGQCCHIEQMRVSDGLFTDPLEEMFRCAARDTGTKVSGVPRKALNTANRRASPSSKGGLMHSPLSAGKTGYFTHYTHGENVEGNDIWFRGTSGNWFWSGAFVGGANKSGMSEYRK